MVPLDKRENGFSPFPAKNNSIKKIIGPQREMEIDHGSACYYERK